MLFDNYSPMLRINPEPSYLEDPTTCEGLPFIATVVLCEYDTKRELVAGTIEGTVLPIYYYNEPQDIILLADNRDDLTCELVEAVLDDNDFDPQLDLQGFGDILCIETVRLEPQYRGYDLSLVAVRSLIETHGRGCAIAVLKPRPTETREGVDGVKALQRHWSRLGFEPTEKNPNVYFVDLGWVIPTPGIRFRRRPKCRKVAA